MTSDAPREVVLVTGSSGYIGSALMAELAKRYVVIGLDRAGSSEPASFAENLNLDLTSDASVRAALARVREGYGTRIASVIHLAAYFDLTGKPDPKYEKVTVQGTARLLKELQSFEVEQFVFASTMLVHAPGQPGRPINEDSPLDPKLPYRASKIRTEKLIREQRGRIPVVFVRPAGVYDDQGHAAFLVHQIARIFERRLNSRVYPGNPDTGQPFLHLDDLIDALMRIIERRKELPAELPVLLAEPQTPTFARLQDEIASDLQGVKWKTWRVPARIARLGAVAANEVFGVDPFIKPWMVDISSDHYEVDISRARTLLGWAPRHSLLKTLPVMLEALRSDPEAWYRTNKLNPASVADKAPTVLDRPVMKKGERGKGSPDLQRHLKEMREMHFGILWVHYLTMALGIWLMASPFAFGAFDPQGFSDSVMRVTAERSLWDPAFRMQLNGWSDVLSGTLIVLFATLSLSPRFSWAQWGSAAVGFWLLFAPLVFWSPSAAVYNNDTLVGALVITFAILVPMMPGMSHEAMMDQSDMPPGWTYTPSAYLQRLPIVALALVGFFIARHMAAYQLGHIDSVWEPFFGSPPDADLDAGENGTEYIITSSVSKAWPVADAGLGAATYMLEVLMGVMGDRRRWRTMPWMVAAFGVVVVPLGVVSIYFIVIQPILIGTWCTLCLIAGFAMVIMIPYSLDELVATGQFLVQDRRRGGRFWRSFFMGGASPGSGHDRQPGWDAPLRQSIASALRGGVNFPWTLVLVALLGLFLMFTRPLLGTEPPMADSDHLVGALIFTVAVMALAEVGRLLRFINVLFGLWLVIAPWILEGESLVGSLVSVAVGLAVVALSLPRGERGREHYGNWDRFVL